MSIFASEADALEMMKGDRLMLAAKTYLGGEIPADPYLKLKLKAAEKEVGRRLMVLLEPTEVFPKEPTAEELAALDGRPYQVEPGYDLPEGMFAAGFIGGTVKLRNKRVTRVHSVRIEYPGAGLAYDVPANWIVLDEKPGMLTFVPGVGAMLATHASTAVMTAVMTGTRVPYMMKVRYTAGLKNIADDYPDVLDAVLRTAVLKVLEDAFLPQSGSISADGLSQSFSADAAKYRDSLDGLLGSLKDQLAGPTWGVL